MSTEDLKFLFEPRSLAIIGASNKSNKVGGAIAKKVVHGSYPGEIYLVNPRLESIFGHRTYPSLDAIPERVDLVEVILPAEAVPDTLLQAVEKGVKAAIVISADFAETGNVHLQNTLSSIAQQQGIRIAGPNCFGLINTMLDLDLTFASTRPLKGDIAFISQSGAMCCGTLDYAYPRGIGFSKFINLGNKCDVDEADVLKYLAGDHQTRTIALYLEGIREGRRFMEAAQKVSAVKPLIAVKAGVTEAGSRAALSHTASLAGRREIIETAFKQSGVIKVDDVEDLIGGAFALATQPTPKGGNVGIITNAGGLGVTVADWCQTLGLNVPVLSSVVKRKIREVLPKYASPENPVDMTGEADYNLYKAVGEIMLDSREIHLLIAVFSLGALITPDSPAQGIAEASVKRGKPVLALFMGGKTLEKGQRILKRHSIPVYNFPEKVSKSAVALVQRMRLLRY